MVGLIKSTSVTKPNNKKNKGSDYIEVSFSAENADVAQKTLGQLVDFVNTNVRQSMTEDLLTEIQTKIKTLNIKKDSLEVFFNTAFNVRLKNLERALLIAQNAQIKEYSKNYNGTTLIPGNMAGEVGIKLKDSRLLEDNFLFMLGEKYLSAQIKTLKETEVIYPEAYYQISIQVDLLSKLLDNKKGLHFDAYHYQSSPSLPLQRDKPKRALIVLIGTFAGGVLGVLVALFMSALESRKRRLA